MNTILEYYTNLSEMSKGFLLGCELAWIAKAFFFLGKDLNTMIFKYISFMVELTITECCYKVKANFTLV